MLKSFEMWLNRPVIEVVVERLVAVVMAVSAALVNMAQFTNSQCPLSTSSWNDGSFPLPQESASPEFLIIIFELMTWLYIWCLSFDWQFYDFCRSFAPKWRRAATIWRCLGHSVSRPLLHCFAKSMKIVNIQFYWFWLSHSARDGDP